MGTEENHKNLWGLPNTKQECLPNNPDTQLTVMNAVTQTVTVLIQ
jgi:hypothetical protein